MIKPGEVVAFILGLVVGLAFAVLGGSLFIPFSCLGGA